MGQQFSAPTPSMRSNSSLLIYVRARGNLRTEKCEMAVSAVRRSLTRLHEAVSAVRRSLSRLHEAVSALRRSLSRLHEAVSAVRRSLSRLHEAVSALRRSLSRLHEAVSAVRRSLTRLHEAVSVRQRPFPKMKIPTFWIFSNYFLEKHKKTCKKFGGYIFSSYICGVEQEVSWTTKRILIYV